MPLFGRSSTATPPDPPKDDRDLATPEEIAQRRRRQLAIRWGVAVAVVLPLLIWAARPTVHAIKGWQARRTAAEAMRLMEAGQGNAAFAKLQDALSLRSTEPEVLRAAAMLLTRAEHGREAINFWSEIEKKRSLTRDEQRDYAFDLLLTGDPVNADKRLRLAWPEGTEGTPADWHLRMQIAVRTRDATGAVALAKRLLEEKTAGVTERQKFNAALTLLSLNNLEQHEIGEKGLRALADGGQSPESLEALLLLLKQASQQINVAREHQKPLPDAATRDLLKLAERVEKHPRAKTAQQLVATQARVIAQPTERERLLQDAIGRFGSSKDDENLAALGSWLYAQQEYRRLLEVMTPERSVGSRALYLLYLDALGAVGRWEDIRHSIEGQRFTLDPMVEQMYLARCATQLRQPESAALRWEAALRVAGTSVDKLLNLARYAQADGALKTAEGAYRAAIKATPDNRPAHEGLLGVLEAQGRTRDARDAIKAMLVVWPQDNAVRNDDAYLGALLNVDLPADRETARELVRLEPASLPHRVTLALAELRSKHDLTALETLQVVNADVFAAQPRYQAVRAAILWATGYPDEARKLAGQIPQNRLMPEEQQLVEPIK